MGARQVFLIPRDAVQQGAEPVGVHCCRCHGDRVQLEVHFNSRTTLETLTIGDFAARSGVAPSALRYYERQGLIRSTRTAGNQRRYERSELRRVAFIKIAQQGGVVAGGDPWGTAGAPRRSLADKGRLVPPLRELAAQARGADHADAAAARPA